MKLFQFLPNSVSSSNWSRVVTQTVPGARNESYMVHEDNSSVRLQYQQEEEHLCSSGVD